MKTSELTGLALDWAVECCECGDDGINRCLLMSMGGRFNPSTNWAQGGPIIEKEGIRLHRSHTGDWWAGAESEPHKPISGPTPLIAAMRCFCCAKLGDEIDIPEELCQSQSS
jgi:hypothetical protein